MIIILQILEKSSKKCIVHRMLINKKGDFAVSIISGVILPFFLLAAGAYFAFLLLPSLLKRREGRPRARGSVRAVVLALAGTLGVGNIAGVASAIALGGAGAIFWIWISALLAMFLKYAEVVLALRHRRYDAGGRAHGGAPYYIRKAFGGRAGRVLGGGFAVLCLLCMFTLGGVVQSAAASEAMQGGFGVPPVITGGLLGLGAAAVLWRGSGGVERACAVLVPVVCVLFSAGSLAAILLRAKALPAVLVQIVREAFSFESAAGGAVGFFTSRAVRYGVARGLVSNEAGCGTAPIAHAAAQVVRPADQGVWGIVEVFVDTILLCTMTALVILTSGVPVKSGGGMAYALAAYGAVLGEFAAPLLAVSVLIFAFATVLCWAYYGRESVYALRGKEEGKLLPLFVAFSCLLGALAAPALVWDVTDLVLGVMTLLNLLALLLLRREVREESRR